MINKRYFIVILLFLPMSLPASSQEASLPLATGEWKPYINGSHDDPGIFIEILDEVFKKMNVKPVYELYPWKRAEYTAQKGIAFAAFPYIKTEERVKIFDFSDPVIFSTGKFFYKKSRFPEGLTFNRFEDLRPYYISGVRGYWYEKDFQAAGLKTEYVQTDEIGFRKLDAERVDLVPTDELVGWMMIRKLFGERASSFAVTEQDLNKDGMCLMVSRTYPDSKKILRLFNEKLEELKSEPKYDQILSKYGIKR